MPIGRRLAAISTALITAAAGLIAMPPAYAVTVTVEIPANSCAVSGDVTVPQFVPADADLAFSRAGSGSFSCNGFAVSADGFDGASDATVSGASTTTLTDRKGALTGDVLATLTDGSVTVRLLNPAASAPGAPTSVTGIAGNTQVSLSWTAPTSTGGSAITGYEVEYEAGGTWTTATSDTGSTSTTYTVTGLTNGTAYTFRVSAKNGVGTGSASSASTAVTPTAGSTIIDKVTICHRTRAVTNPYVLITVSVNSVIGSGGRNGHADHNSDANPAKQVNPTGNGITPGSGPFDTSFASSPGYPSNQKLWGDIIPPFTYSGGTYAGLNWSPAWNTPDPSSGTSSWLEDDEFAAAVRAGRTYPFSSPTVYDNAAAQCLDLATGQQSTKSSEMDTPEKYFNVSVRNGEDPDSIREDLVDQEAESMGGGTPGGTPISIPTTTSLETTYNNAASVTTDAASGIGRTSATLNGTLKSGTTWTTWKFEWATSTEDVAGSTDNYSSTTIPSANGSGDREVEYELTGLTCATEYFFRVTGNTTEVGLIRSFTTSACPGNSGGGNSGGGNSGGGNSGGGNGNSGNNPESTPSTGSTTPPGPTPTVGGGRPPRLTLPPAGPANRPVTPGNSSTPGTPANPGNSNTSSPGDDDNATSTPGSTGSQTAGTPANPVTTVYRPRNLTPTTSVPAPPGTAWEPTQTRIQDPRTGEPTLRVTNEAGTWAVDERSGAITYTPAVGYTGSATVNVVLVARSGEIFIHPMRVPIAFTSRVKIVSGDVPRDISGGVARIIRPWQR